jgi:hypothetical protein
MYQAFVGALRRSCEKRIVSSIPVELLAEIRQTTVNGDRQDNIVNNSIGTGLRCANPKINSSLVAETCAVIAVAPE